CDTGLVSDRLAQEVTEHDRAVLGGVVVVDLEVAFALQRQVEAGVARERCQHVVEKPDAAAHLCVTAPVDVEGRRDLGLAGHSRSRYDAGGHLGSGEGATAIAPSKMASSV